jgi:hypothetical protein
MCDAKQRHHFTGFFSAELSLAIADHLKVVVAHLTLQEHCRFCADEIKHV